VSAVSPGAAGEEAPAAITVCYPRDGDTLWSVAKRFRVPVAALGAVNGLGESALERAAIPESLDGIASLVVVRPGSGR
ncbi:MAG: LysM peptidoglycan-binding domain-containing protein, partial [Clostridia bacterium]|nr:LysM peptidoglycan-binding domain-containing protein [Clostridia bacterium]MBQ4298606.1 LysM peptidoglycan-binding domain-containing protein [Clostridia bacterium]